MVYKKVYRKKTYKKRYNGKRTTLNSKIARIAKRVALRTQETKHHVTNYGDFSMFHNVSRRIADNLCTVQQGTQDGTNASRIGDHITLRGVKVYMHFEQFTDRPNVTFKIWVLKAHDAALGLGIPIKNITGNLMLDPINMETVKKVVAVRTYKFNQNNIVHDGDVANNKRVVNFRTLWIPLRGDYHFTGDNSAHGRDYDLAMYAACYDASNTLITDNIAHIEFSSELFFKDA